MAKLPSPQVYPLPLYFQRGHHYDPELGSGGWFARWGQPHYKQWPNFPAPCSNPSLNESTDLCAFLSSVYLYLQRGHHYHPELGSGGWFARWGRPYYKQWPNFTRDAAGNEMPAVRSEFVREAMKEFQVGMPGPEVRENDEYVYCTPIPKHMLKYTKVKVPRT